jgi:hypothetical protein
LVGKSEPQFYEQRLGKTARLAPQVSTAPFCSSIYPLCACVLSAVSKTAQPQLADYATSLFAKATMFSAPAQSVGDHLNAASAAVQEIELAEAGIHISQADLKGCFTQFFDITSVSAAVGKHLDDLFLADKEAKLQQLADLVISTNKVQKARLKLRLFSQSKISVTQTATRPPRWFEVSIFPKRHPTTSVVVGVTAIFIDLGSESASGELEAQLRLRIKELEDLNAALIHAKDIAQSAQKSAENAEHAKSDFLAMMSQ